MGTSKTTNTFIRQIDSLLIGQTPATYDTINGKMSGLGMRFLNNGGYCLMDMYSSGLTDTYPASRIRSIGGDTTLNNGTLQMESGAINIIPIGNTTITNTIKNITNLIVGQYLNRM